MIGFQAELNSGGKREDESLDTQRLNKVQLYELVETTWDIPSYGCKSITREYLLRVKDDEVFRVDREVMRKFDFELTKKQNKKMAIVNLGYVVRKLKVLMAEKRMKDLGFEEWEAPEQVWLMRMARYIDKENVLELFEEALVVPPNYRSNSSLLYSIYHGRLFASTYLFRDAKTKSNKGLWESLRNISESYKVICSASINIELLERELNEMREKLARSKLQMEEEVTKTAVTYTALTEPNLRYDMVLRPELLSEPLRNQLQNNTRL